MLILHRMMEKFLGNSFRYSFRFTLTRQEKLAVFEELRKLLRQNLKNLYFNWSFSRFFWT